MAVSLGGAMNRDAKSTRSPLAKRIHLGLKLGSVLGFVLAALAVVIRVLATLTGSARFTVGLLPLAISLLVSCVAGGLFGALVAPAGKTVVGAMVVGAVGMILPMAASVAVIPGFTAIPFRDQVFLVLLSALTSGPWIALGVRKELLRGSRQGQPYGSDVEKFLQRAAEGDAG